MMLVWRKGCIEITYYKLIGHMLEFGQPATFMILAHYFISYAQRIQILFVVFLKQ